MFRVSKVGLEHSLPIPDPLHIAQAHESRLMIIDALQEKEMCVQRPDQSCGSRSVNGIQTRVHPKKCWYCRGSEGIQQGFLSLKDTVCDRIFTAAMEVIRSQSSLSVIWSL